LRWPLTKIAAGLTHEAVDLSSPVAAAQVADRAVPVPAGLIVVALVDETYVRADRVWW
jgi:hypothetical protein